MVFWRWREESIKAAELPSPHPAYLSRQIGQDGEELGVKLLTGCPEDCPHQ